MPIDLTLAYSRGEASYTGGTKGEFHVCRIERVFSNKFLKTGCLLLGVIALSQPVLATEFEMSRLATELNAASSQLAKQLRGGGYHSVRFSAQRLTRASADLLNAIRRNRSPSFLRSEFRDVARHYQEMEQAFLRLSREHDRNVYHAVGTVCNLFTGLNSEFYHARYAQPAPDVYIATPPVVTRYRLPPYHTDRSRNCRYGQRPSGQSTQPNRRATGIIRTAF